MMPVDLASILFCLLIVALVLFAFWKHGRGNPENTGQLARKIDAQGTAIAALEVSVKDSATRGSLDLLAEQVRNLEAHAASSGEVVALEAKIVGLRELMTAKIDAVARASDDTREGVRRIEAILMKGALDR